VTGRTAGPGRLRAVAALLALAALVGPPLWAAGPSDAEVEKAAARISAASALRTVEILAAPGMQGRLSGTEGYRKAADWVVSEVRNAGLRPTDDFRDYLQPFTHGLGGVESASLTLLPAEGEKDGKPAEAEVL